MVCTMKRDMDLIRDLLLKIEDGQRSFDLLTPEIAEILGDSGGGRLPREQAELNALCDELNRSIPDSIMILIEHYRRTSN